MRRTFEEAYNSIFSEAPNIFSYILFLIILISSFIKNTKIYLIEFIIFCLFFFIVGRRLWSKLGVFKVTSFSVGIGALFDLIAGKPPLHYLVLSSLATSSMAMALRCNSKLYLLPIAATPLFYLYAHDYALAAASAVLAISTPPVRRYLAERVHRGDALCMLSSFLYSSVSAEGMFDYAFKPLGVEEKGKVRLYLIENGGRFLFVVSDFHPGPFRNVGGGILVEKLVTRGLRGGYDVVFLHGVGGHERDPVSSEDVERIVDEVFRAASSLSTKDVDEGVIHGKLEVGDVRVVAYSLGVGPPLAIVSRINSAADDIPLDVARRIDDKGLVLVDAQNKFDGTLRWTEEDVASLQRALEALSKLERCKGFRIGVGKADASFVDPLRLELGAGGIAAVVAQCGNRKALLLVFDGNNMDAAFYKKLVEKFKGAYDLVEAITTDTHASTGMGVGNGGYRTVGSGIRHEELLKLAERAVAVAERSLGTPKRGAYGEIEIAVKVFGPNFAQIRSVVESYKKLGILMLAYLVLVPLLLATLL